MTEHVYADAVRDLPLLVLPAYDTGFGRPVPEKYWCWTHAKWELTVAAKEGQ